MSTMTYNKSSKKPNAAFTYQLYIQADNQIEYISNLLLLNLQRKKMESAIICLNELNDILIEMKIPLKVRQLHELYLFASFNKNDIKMQAKHRVAALMNNQKRRVDVVAISKWLNENIKKGSIKFSRNRAHSQVHHLNQSLKIGQVEKNQSKTKTDKQWKLPPIHGSSSEKLTEQLKYLVEIFEEMQKQRQNSGLIPINLQSDDQELDLSAANIPYDPELYDLNKSLAKLRIKAEDRLARIIELARDEPKIKAKLQEAIQKFQRVRIEANEKVGRIGSMKAQKRLIQNRKKQENKLRNLRLNQQQDLLRAAKLYSLLSIQQRKPSKLIL